MILSHRWRFVFIKGRKVAGTSVEIALSTICGPDDVITPITPIDEKVRKKIGAREPQNHHDKFYNHMPLREVVALTGPLNGYHIFCVERSPYSKVISWANAFSKFAAYERNGGVMKSSFEEIRRVIDRRRKFREKNIDLYRNESGAVIASPLRYLCLSSDLASFLHRIGAPTVASLPHVKRGLLSDNLDPREILRRDQIDRINEVFSEEFDTFGYEMI